jgi:hypothetical protein
MMTRTLSSFLSASLATLRRYGWLPILVLLSHELCAHVIDGYARWPQIDIPFHFIGGFAIAYFLNGGLHILEERKILPPLQAWVKLGLLLGLVSTTALFWEFAEYLADTFFGTFCQLSLEDTLLDLLLGLLGGILFLLPQFIRACRRLFASVEVAS